jgi:hypothetical protein
MGQQARLEIHPYQGVAGIQFGMTPLQVQQVLGTNPLSPLERSIPLTDLFDAIGIQVFYTQSGVCEAIELSAPANPAIKGQSLIGQPFAQLEAWFQAIDPTVITDESGLISPQLGIGLYAPFAEDAPDDPVEAVLVFEAGYYRA